MTQTRLCIIVSVLTLSVIHPSAFLVAAGPTPPAPEEIGARIDQVFLDWNQRDSPGASVAVIKDGHIIFSKGYGLANLEYGAPITPETVFHVASVSKQFTAMALVLLEQDGKITLEDDIRKHLPDLPDYGNKITWKQDADHNQATSSRDGNQGRAGLRHRRRQATRPWCVRRSLLERRARDPVHSAGGRQ